MLAKNQELGPVLEDDFQRVVIHDANIGVIGAGLTCTVMTRHAPRVGLYRTAIRPQSCSRTAV